MPSSFATSVLPPPIPKSFPAMGGLMDRRHSAEFYDGSAGIEERLFELRREAVALSNRHDPRARVAALLLSIADTNRYEGRDPSSVPQSLSCGFVADLLRLSIEDLAGVLRDLEARDLIEPGGASTLKLKNIPALSALADAA